VRWGSENDTRSLVCTKALCVRDPMLTSTLADMSSAAIVICSLLAYATLASSDQSQTVLVEANKDHLVNVFCGDSRWTLLDTLVSLPLSGTSVKASRSWLLQGLVPVSGTLEVSPLHL